MQLLGPEDFEPWVGRKVRINTVPQPIELTLERVELAQRYSGALDFRQPFSLIFEGPLGAYLLNETYEFDCGRGGPHNIFITQMTPTPKSRIYQATFN